MAATGTIRAVKDGRDEEALRSATRQRRRPNMAATGTLGVKKGCLLGSEIGSESGVYFVTSGKGPVDDADAIDLSFDALDAIRLAVDVLLKDVTNAFAVDVEAGKELLSTTERCTIVDGDTAYHNVDALAMKVFETDADTLNKLVTGDLEIVLVVGVVDNSLDVTFVVARLQLQGVSVFFHFLIKKRGWKIIEISITTPSPIG